MLIYVILGIVLVAADQLIKRWVVENLMPVKVMDFIRFGDFEILGLRYCENTGAAFSSFSGARWFLTVLVTVMLVALLVFTVRYKHKRTLFLVSSVMVMSGGVGNLIDRVRLGYVIDYLDVKLFNFAVFNFADVCVVVGAFLLLIFLFFIEPKIINAEKEQANEQT
ncbi:MAG: signal peptidase II [Ruminococcus sp.]|nr:signal peptidase II [Ruminococcus sp.]MCM1382172.1 signal peptidase II [Muribaculaceae bacterium]MCM1480299.1 signal peptidase II [Muribaculaceae bacterium]